MTQNLNSYRAWIKYYEVQVKLLPCHVGNDHASCKTALLSISLTALDSQAKDLRDSDSYQKKKFKTAFAGLFPFEKIFVSIAESESFVDEALLAFGLSDQMGIKELAKKLKTTLSGSDDVAIDVLTTLASFSKTEILAHMGTHTAGELVHGRVHYGNCHGIRLT
jgi:hypothetical protein